MGLVSLLYTLIAGDEAKASEVMANFNAIVAEINGNIQPANLQDNSVTTPKIANNAVTSGKLHDSAVTTSKIADDNVTAAKIADGAIDTAEKIANGVITAAKLVSGAFSLATGTYTGDGAMGHAINHGSTWTPIFVLTMSESTFTGTRSWLAWTFTGMSATQALDMVGGGGNANSYQIATGVTAMGVGSFTLGNHAAVNNIGKLYFYICGADI